MHGLRSVAPQLLKFSKLWGLAIKHLRVFVVHEAQKTAPGFHLGLWVWLRVVGRVVFAYPPTW
jgi:hypothetical protein